MLELNLIFVYNFCEGDLCRILCMVISSGYFLNQWFRWIVITNDFSMIYR